MTNTRPHADTGVEGGQRWQCPKRITTNVTGSVELQFLDCIKHPTMGASRTHIWGTGRNILRIGEKRFLRGSHHLFPDNIRRQFPTSREGVFPQIHLDPHNLKVLFNKGVQFLNNIEFFDLRTEVTNHLFGKRPNHPKFEIRGIRENLLGVLVGNP